MWTFKYGVDEVKKGAARFDWVKESKESSSGCSPRSVEIREHETSRSEDGGVAFGESHPSIEGWSQCHIDSRSLLARRLKGKRTREAEAEVDSKRVKGGRGEDSVMRDTTGRFDDMSAINDPVDELEDGELAQTVATHGRQRVARPADRVPSSQRQARLTNRKARDSRRHGSRLKAGRGPASKGSLRGWSINVDS